MRELRYAWRSLTRTPGFALTALLILTMSVGAIAAVFSMLYALVLRPIDAPRPHELVQLTTFNHRGQNADLTWRQYRAIGDRQQVFSSIVASIQQLIFTVETGHTAVRATISGVSSNYFAEFDVSPALGRLIEPADLDESTGTGEPVVVLGWDFWQRQFGGDSTVLGRSITVDSVQLTVIGVAPRRFLGLSIAIEHDITVPITMIPKIASEETMFSGTSSWIIVTGRLRDGLTVAQARAQLQAIWPSVLTDSAPQTLATSQRDEYLRRTISVDSGATGWGRGLRLRYTNALYVLMGIAAIMLLIAGVNLCSLAFTRANARHRELSLRLALGSSRGRLIRELAIEGSLLGVAGTAAGLGLAALATDWLAAFLLRDYGVRSAFDASPDRGVTAAALVCGVTMAMTVTATAAWLATRRYAAFSGGSRTVTRTSSIGHGLVGVQVALSIVLLSHASLLARSVASIATGDAGFNRDSLLSGYTIERVGKYRMLDLVTYYPQALDRVKAVPGVTAAAFITAQLQGGALPLEPTGRALTLIGDDDVAVEVPQVSAGFFETVGLPIVRGRDFGIGDTDATARVAILSEALERRLFGEGQGLGARVRISRRPEWQDVLVVGIAQDASLFDVRGGNRLIVYTPAVQSGNLANYKYLIARAPETAVPLLQRAIDDLGVEYIASFQTVEYSRGRTILQERVLAGLSAFFGALALLLVSAGVYGLLTYALSLRRKEFGIRLALGAEPARIAAQLVGSIAVTMTAGIGSGLALTALTAPALRSVLVRTSPYDLAAIGAASIVLLLCGALASAAPSLRASRVEPLSELRHD